MFQLNAMGKGEQGLTFRLRSLKHDRDARTADGYESDEWSAPRKVQRTQLFRRLMHGLAITPGGRRIDSGEKRSTSSADSSSISPTTPPIYNHRNSRRRKGIPQRAPF